MSRKVVVNISEELYNEIEYRVKNSGGDFINVKQYIEFIIEEVLKKEEPDNEFTLEEEAKIKERLRKLGYI